MMRIAGERKKPVLRVERGGLIVDRFHLDGPKSDLAGNTEAAVEGVQEEEFAQPLAKFRLGDGQAREEKTWHRVLRQPFEQFRRGVGELEMTRGQSVVAKDARLPPCQGDVSRS